LITRNSSLMRLLIIALRANTITRFVRIIRIRFVFAGAATPLMIYLLIQDSQSYNHHIPLHYSSLKKNQITLITTIPFFIKMHISPFYYNRFSFGKSSEIFFRAILYTRVKVGRDTFMILAASSCGKFL
jgi:hypothetical protein